MTLQQNLKPKLIEQFWIFTTKTSEFQNKKLQKHHRNGKQKSNPCQYVHFGSDALVLAAISACWPGIPMPDHLVPPDELDI